jgi:serine/threonine-protein kinase
MGPAKPTTTRVPEIVGKSVADAEALLQAAGLRVERVSPSEQGEPGMVAAVVPDVGTTIDVGAGVVLSVAERKVKVPRLLDEHIHEARERLAKAGLKVGDVSEIYDSRRRGNRVLNQDPEAGTLVLPGTEVKLVVNQGD